MNYLEAYVWASKIRYFHRGSLRAGVATPHPGIRKGIGRDEMYLEKYIS
jgi:hypothetical protein